MGSGPASSSGERLGTKPTKARERDERQGAGDASILQRNGEGDATEEAVVVLGYFGEARSGLQCRVIQRGKAVTGLPVRCAS